MINYIIANLSLSKDLLKKHIVLQIVTIMWLRQCIKFNVTIVKPMKILSIVLIKVDYHAHILIGSINHVLRRLFTLPVL